MESFVTTVTKHLSGSSTLLRKSTARSGGKKQFSRGLLKPDHESISRTVEHSPRRHRTKASRSPVLVPTKCLPAPAQSRRNFVTQSGNSIYTGTLALRKQHHQRKLRRLPEGSKPPSLPGRGSKRNIEVAASSSASSDYAKSAPAAYSPLHHADP